MTGTFIDPPSVERAIRECSDRLQGGVKESVRRYEVYQAAEQAFKQAEAHAYVNHAGPQTEKRMVARLATADLKKERDRAYAAYKYSDELARAVGKELSALQSINGNVRSAYNAGGGLR